MYSSLRLSLALVAVIFSTQVIAGGDAVQGKVLADTCKGCHAVDSYTNVYPTYHVPRIAGQSADYLAMALTLYRDGNREHPTMIAQAASFSDEDIQDIAAYLSGVGPQLDSAAAPTGEVPPAAVVCAACTSGISMTEKPITT